MPAHITLPIAAILNQLTAPIWVIDPHSHEQIYANRQAEAVAGGATLDQLRDGQLAVHGKAMLAGYLPGLRRNDEVVEIWSLPLPEGAMALRCRFTLLLLEEGRELLLVEGGVSVPIVSSQSVTPAGRERELFESLFRTNAAPMLLIDALTDGRIVDANQAALRFYGYPREVLMQMHTWQINTLGRDVVPVMQEIAKLPGGHKPLNFVHRMADGSERHVQTYAGPITLGGRSLMLSVIHDITEQRRLEEELKRAALQDPLTGLWNRRHFMAQLSAMEQNQRRREDRWCLMMLDVDYFKQINDRYGHDTGDRVLVALARCLAARMRSDDTLCRWGGEEFVVLLPRTKLPQALELAESLRAAVARLSEGDLPSFTLSFGVVARQEGEVAQQVVHRADTALYSAKVMGRNRVVAG
jgi:diguanylate cyclase